MTTTAAQTVAMPKPHRDRGIEGSIAKWYAATTAKSRADFQQLAQRIANQLPRGGSVLEIAPGPGYLCIELSKLGPYAIRGVDLSASMVKIARQKAAESGAQVEFEQGNASNLPYPQDTFDFLVCRAAFKNFARPVQALDEMHRVLKPGGRGLIVDLRRDASRESVNQAVDQMGLGLVNRIITKLTFRFMLLKSAYAKVHLEQMLARTHFSKVEIVEEGIGLEVWMTKAETRQ